MEWRITHEEEIANIAYEVLSILAPSETQATVLALEGTLGAGKTTFVRALARVLGVREHIKSPTFVIESRYSLKDSAWEQLVHIDAYRLEEGAQLAPLRFEEVLHMPRTLVCIEWPEHVASALPRERYTLSLAPKGDERLITFAPPHS